MPSTTRMVTFVALTLHILGPGSPDASARQTSEYISVRDMVRFSVIGDPETTDEGGGGYNTIQWIAHHWAEFSPNGSQVAIIVRYGDIQANETKAAVYVLPTVDLLTHPTPRAIATFASNSNIPPIADLRWLRDGRTLIAISEAPSTPPELREIDTKTGAVSAITDSQTGIRAYDITQDGRRVAFLAPTQVRNAPDRGGLGYTINTGALADALGLSNGNMDYERPFSLIVLDLGTGELLNLPNPAKATILGAPKAGHVSLDGCRDDAGVSISPDGEYAIRTCRILYAPRRWRQYAWSSDQTLDRGLDPKSSSNWRNQHVVIDLERGTAAIAFDAPLPEAGWGRPMAWMPGGHVALIADVLVPGSRSHSTYSVVSLDVSNGHTETILSGPVVSALSWDSSDNVLRVQIGTINPLNGVGSARGEADLYRHTPLGWVQSGEGPAIDSNSNGKVELHIRESINAAPTLWASERSGKRSALVLDPNPWIHDKRLGRVEPVAWRAFGQRWSGGIYFPPDYQPGHRYPLVIQTHGFDPDRFSLYGRSTSAFAAQPLASSGIIVLQMNDLGVEAVERAKPGKRQIARLDETIERGYESAIDELDGRGLIDPARVGIIGWSASCRYVKYFLTHTKYLVQAATISDGYDAGYMQYLAFPNLQPYIADDVGTAPYDDAEGPWATRWEQADPDFRPEFVHTPVRIEALGGESALLGQWEFFAGLRSLHAPAELYYQPSGAHEAIQPRYWYGSAQGDVDWFRFWLQGYRDPDSAKAAQYSRWEKLCDAQSVAHPHQPSFCVHTTH